MKTVLFVCIENSCRSQMAEGLANRIGKGVFTAYSAGSRPSGTVNPDAIRVMAEDDIDIASAVSKGFDSLPIKEFDIAITLGCKDTCPLVLAHDHREWVIEDPKGNGIEFFRQTRDTLKDNIWKLAGELTDNECFID